MPSPSKPYPFVLRVLFFAAVYTVIVTILDILYPILDGGRIADYAWNWDREGRFFLIGICVAGASLLFFRFRRPNFKK